MTHLTITADNVQDIIEKDILNTSKLIISRFETIELQTNSHGAVQYLINTLQGVFGASTRSNPRSQYGSYHSTIFILHSQFLSEAVILSLASILSNPDFLTARTILDGRVFFEKSTITQHGINFLANVISRPHCPSGLTLTLHGIFRIHCLDTTPLMQAMGSGNCAANFSFRVMPEYYINIEIFRRIERNHTKFCEVFAQAIQARRCFNGLNIDLSGESSGYPICAALMALSIPDVAQLKIKRIAVGPNTGPASIIYKILEDAARYTILTSPFSQPIYDENQWRSNIIFMENIKWKALEQQFGLEKPRRQKS